MQSTLEDDTPGPGLSPVAVRLLAGLESGLIAGLPAIAWLLFHSWLRGEPWWAKLNVAGALFFGGSVYTMGLSRASAAGAALLIAVFAVLGAAFGLAARTRGITRNLILGSLVAIAWQLASQQYLLRLVDPFAPAYYPPLSTLPANLMFGIGLARFGPRFQALATTFGDPSWAWDWFPKPQLAELPSPDPPQIAQETEENVPLNAAEEAESKRTQETDC